MGKGLRLNVLGLSMWTPLNPPPRPLAEADSQASVEHLRVGPSSTVQGGGWAFGLEPRICLLAGASGTMGPGFRAHLGMCPETAPTARGPPFLPAAR